MFALRFSLLLAVPLAAFAGVPNGHFQSTQGQFRLEKCPKLVQRMKKLDWSKAKDFGEKGEAREIEGERRRLVWKGFLARKDGAEPLGMPIFENDPNARAHLQSIHRYAFVPMLPGFGTVGRERDPRFYIGLTAHPKGERSIAHLFLNPLGPSLAPELVAAHATYTTAVLRRLGDRSVLQQVKRFLSDEIIEEWDTVLRAEKWHKRGFWPFVWYVKAEGEKTIATQFEDRADQLLALLLADIYGRIGTLGFYARHNQTVLQSNYWDEWLAEYAQPQTFLPYMAKRIEKETGIPSAPLTKLLEELALSPVSEAWDLPELYSNRRDLSERFRMVLQVAPHRKFTFNLIRLDDRLWIDSNSSHENSVIEPGVVMHFSQHHLNAFAGPQSRRLKVTLDERKVVKVQVRFGDAKSPSLKITAKGFEWDEGEKAFFGDVSVESMQLGPSQMKRGARISEELMQALKAHGTMTE